MNRALYAALSLCLVLSLAGLSHAQCTTQPTVNSISISPSTIFGDGSQFATATVQACVQQGSTELHLYIQPSGMSSNQFVCNGGGLSSYTCNFYGVGPGNVTVSFSFNGINYGTTDNDGTILVSAYSPGTVSAGLTVTGAGTIEPDPTQTTCHACGYPINATSGNTWIQDVDYSRPGLGGGLSLTRTWNSLWPSMSPPEESGIFGDSWRSSFEERIQLLGLPQYWMSDGSARFFFYDGVNNAYYMGAPADDPTTLMFDPNSNLWIVTQLNGTHKTFNQAGYLTSIVDRNGNTTTINIDPNHQNRIANVTDPSGNVLTFNYSDANNPRLCTSLSDSMGTFTQYQYDDATQRLIQVSYPDGSQKNYQYSDPNGNTLISLVTDSMGKTIEANTYDSQRRGVTSQQANDSNGNPVNRVSVNYAFQGQSYQNRVCDSTQNDCVVVQVSTRAQRHYISLTTGPAPKACATCSFTGNSRATFDASGYRTSSTDGNGNITLYSYDLQGNLLSTSQRDFYTSAWDTWNYTYNSFGQVLTATDPLGTAAGDANHTTVNAYDTKGNLLSVTTPSPDGGTTLGSATAVTYYANGTLKTVTDPLGNVTTMTYYPSGLMHTVTDAAANVTTYAYDGRGNRTSVTDANNHQTQFQYDSMNRLTKTIYPDSSTVQFGYDYRGRRISVTDQNGKVTQYAYDDADRLISVTDAQTPTAGVTSYAYDTENDLTDIYDAAGNHTQFVYFPGQYLYKTVFPSGQSESYSWDNNNNLEYRIDRKGNMITYNYDSQNRLYYKEDPGTVMYAYDRGGRMTEVDDYNSSSRGSYTFAYDNMNRLTSATTSYNFTSAGPWTVQYGYDAASNRVSMTDPQGTQTTYGYDALNRLTSLGNSWAGSFGFSYDNLSRRTQLTRPNGVNTSYSYDNLSRLLSVLHQSGGTTLDGAAYTYDAAGNRATNTNYLNAITSNYAYDPLYELTQVTQGTSTTESYSYDAVGNRLSSSGVPSYNYNSLNELASNSSGSYTYDANGNTLSDPSGKSYSWDFENRLTQVVNPGVGNTTFKYDPFGRRIQKSGPLGTTNYLYDGNTDIAIEEIDNTGSLLARYSQVQDFDEPLAQQRAGATSFYESDVLGSVTSLSSVAGAISNAYAYDSFGKTTSSTGTVANPFRYTGRELDPETGTYYFRARYYDPNSGRFVSEDPIRLSGRSINFYRYVGNDPLIMTDPLGLSEQCTEVGLHALFSIDEVYTHPGPWELGEPSSTDPHEEDVGVEGLDPLATVGCLWTRTIGKEKMKETLVLVTYDCTETLPCGVIKHYRKHRLKWNETFVSFTTDIERAVTPIASWAADSEWWYQYECSFYRPK